MGITDGVADYAAAVRNYVGGAAADIEEAGAEFALVLSEAGFGGGERLEDCVADDYSGAIYGGDDILSGGGGGGDDVDVRFEALADHADGVADAVLAIEHEFLREDVEDFAIFGEADIAGGFDGAADVIFLDVAGALA